jgi:adenine-specific DNA-methyltransferase
VKSCSSVRLICPLCEPISIIYVGVEQATEKDSIVLDFFSGSSTSAQAVMQVNSVDGGNRKFIMVQLPEKCDEKSEAFKAGYKNICEIGKERIRRAGEKIKEEAGLTARLNHQRNLKADII